MDRKWLPLNALRAFEAAGQHLSFTAAANSLTVAQSAVSRHVIVLENFLGVALFERRPADISCPRFQNPSTASTRLCVK
jgi:DNA-binding transcriptional LysR family regulator